LPLVVAGGPTTREIAVRLFVSERTVEDHVASTLNKLGPGTLTPKRRSVRAS
jgi:DNA-binding NarL/FixJ family response regulator